MEEKNKTYINDDDFSKKNLDYLSKNNPVDKDELYNNKEQENLYNSEDIKNVNSKAEIENKEVPKAEINEDLKSKIDNSKAEIENKEVPNAGINEKFNPKEKNKELDNKIPENKITDNNLKPKQISNDKSTSLKKESLDLKTKVKPKKEIPIEKKPFNEFINEHLIPEIKIEFTNRGKVINKINIKKTNRPISEDICWVIYCEVKDTCNFWLSFEKEDITSPKSFSLCKNYEKPSIIESFLIDEKKITLKLIISRILQRLNGQKLFGAN